MGSITYEFQNSLCFLLFNLIVLLMLLHSGSGFHIPPDSQVRRSAVVPLRLCGMMNLANKSGVNPVIYRQCKMRCSA